MFIVPFPFDMDPALILCRSLFLINTTIKSQQIDKNQEGEVEEEEFLSGCTKNKELANICVRVYINILKIHILSIYI